MAVSDAIIRACLLYEFKLGTKAAEACRKICAAFGEGTIAEQTGQSGLKNFLLEMKTLKIWKTIHCKQRGYQAGNQAGLQSNMSGPCLKI